MGALATGYFVLGDYMLGDHRAVSGGWEGSARTDLDLGNGCVVEGRTFGGVDSVVLSVSVLRYDEPPETEITRITIGWQFLPDLGEPCYEPAAAGIICSVSGAMHGGERGEWGVGPAWGIGVGFFRRRWELYSMATGILWLGEDADDDFTAGAEGALKLVAGARF